MNKTLLAALAAFVTAAVALGGYLALRPVTSSGAPPGSAAASYDPAEARETAHDADDVFHGTVVRLSGRRTIAEIPSRLYEVRVGQVFKGRLTGTVTVTQPQGDPALEEGGKYVLATTSWHNEDDEHGLLPGSRPFPAPDLTTPVRNAATGAETTLADYWRRAAAPHEGARH
ncbi:hypothetical protein [Streptomyces sp. NPDC015131]|uniref:hypothetical protein n=1 Tax=Streptomyces sp. NPDC015131 TaxID=3364941 RepID=UPI0036F82537